MVEHAVRGVEIPSLTQQRLHCRHPDRDAPFYQRVGYAAGVERLSGACAAYEHHSLPLGFQLLEVLHIPFCGFPRLGGASIVALKGVPQIHRV